MLVSNQSHGDVDRVSSTWSTTGGSIGWPPRAPDKGRTMRLEVGRRSSTPPAGSDSGTDVTEALGETTPFLPARGSSQAHAGIADQRVEQLRVQP